MFYNEKKKQGKTLALHGSLKMVVKPDFEGIVQVQLVFLLTEATIIL